MMILLTDFQSSSTSTVLLSSSAKAAIDLDTDREDELSWSFGCVSLLLQSFFKNLPQGPLKVLRWKEVENSLGFGDHAPATWGHPGIDAQHRRIKAILNMIRFEW